MPQKRDTVVPVRLNDVEALRLDKVRRAKGLPRSSYMRVALLEKLDRDEAEASHAHPANRHKPK